MGDCCRHVYFGMSEIHMTVKCPSQSCEFQTVGDCCRHVYSGLSAPEGREDLLHPGLDALETAALLPV